MKLFGKERESLRIKEVSAARAVMVLHEEVTEVNIRVKTEEGQVLDLQFPERLLNDLLLELSDVYEAIHPPLRRGSRVAGWMGMRNDS